MNIKTILAACVLSLSAALAQAGGNHADGHTHEHSINARQAETRAQKVVDQLIDKKVVEPSWKGSKPVESAQKAAGEKKLWQVTFKNATAADPAKQTLYVFLSAGGKYVAANHSGRF